MAALVDVLIIGAGPAGLSAALTLGRQAQRAVVFDSRTYRNDATDYMHLIPGWDHAAPSAFRASGKENLVSRYDSISIEDNVDIETVRQVDAGVFEAVATDGRLWRGKKIILASGVEDVLPDIKGYADCWAKSIFHCLFCKGFEQKGCSSAGVLASNGGLGMVPHALHAARQSAQLCQSVTLYTNGSEELASQLASALGTTEAMKVDTRRIQQFALGHNNAGLVISFDDGTEATEGFLVHVPPTRVRGPFASQLGLAMTPGGDIKVSQPFPRTSVPGVYAAGDNSSPLKNVPSAIFTGHLAAQDAMAMYQSPIPISKKNVEFQSRRPEEPTMSSSNSPTIFDLIQQQVHNQPHASAISRHDSTLSYAQLDAASRSIASLLRGRGVGTGDAVAILTSRCPEWVACVLAVVRIGAVWVPMDAESWSRDRIDTVLTLVAPKAVLVTADESSQDMMFSKFSPARTTTDGAIISPAEIRQALNGPPPPIPYDSCDDDHGPATPDSPAYIIFTSGTTGRPKGVVVSHRSLALYVSESPFNLTAGPSDTVLCLFSVAFDACYGVLLSALCGGAHVVLSSPATVLDDARACTVLPATPTLLGLLGPETAPYAGVRAIFLGGEPPSPELVTRWWAPGRRMYNAYGPTEATIAVSIAELKPGGKVTIGTPIRGCKLVLVDEDDEENRQGEIAITGPCLAMGYFNDEAQTAAKFVQWRGERAYRTGDLGRREGEDGIVFLGRRDGLVKNRGFLVNLEVDVVPTLLAQPGVEAAAAVMHRKRLVAFVVTTATANGADVDTDGIRGGMVGVSDAFLVPDEIHAVEQLPRTANGKVDGRAVQQMLVLEDEKEETNGALGVSGISSGISSEEDAKLGVLRAAIAEVLGSQRASLSVSNDQASFWELGGNSMGFSIAFPDLFLLPSLAKIAKALQPTDATDTATTRMTATQTGLVRSTILHPPAGYMLISISLPLPADDTHHLDLRGSWESVLARHSIFRSSFDLANGLQLERCVEADGDPAEAVEREKAALLSLVTPSNNNENIFRPATAFRLIKSKRSSVLLWLVHHSLVDGWAVGVVVREVRARLRGESLGGINSVPFSRYSDALPGYLENSHAQARQFWSEAMDGLLDGTQLRVRFGEARLSLDLSLAVAETSARVMGGVSPAVVVYAAWALLLSSYSSTDKVVFGTVFSGRNFPMDQAEQMVGPMINTCPFPVRLPTGAPATDKGDLLQHVQALLLRISEYQWSAAEVLQELASGSHARIFSTMVTLEYDLAGFAAEESQNDKALQDWQFGRDDFPEFALTLQVQNLDGELACRALFDKSIYDSALINRMLGHFRRLFHALLDPRVQTLGEVLDGMLAPGEFMKLTRNFPAYFEPCLTPPSLKEAFESGVDQWPDAAAVEVQSTVLTYAQLDGIANDMANTMGAHGVKPGDVVALIGDGSLNWLVGVISIIKAGAVYLPLDIKLPAQRMQKMAEAAGAVLCVFTSDDTLAALFSVHPHRMTMAKIITAPATARLRSVTRPDDYAYVIFTSGSTGHPKGVRVTHRATLSHLAYAPARLHSRPGRRQAQVFSPGFDVNLAEVFGTLCFGATLVLKDPKDPFAHLARVHAAMMTPSLLAAGPPPGELRNLDTIYLIGEAVPQDLADRWAPDRCTIAALFKRLLPKQPVALGRAIPRVGVYLLDRASSRPVPVGVTGEICLSGVQVMEGYIGMEEATRKAFVADPFVPGARMYRTGDLGVWTEDLELRFLGRVDFQVKVRGYRIELEEVENVIANSGESISRAVALVHQENVLAFVTPETVDVAAVLHAARTQLPSYACPSAVIPLASLPMTPNQKLDRKALIEMATAKNGTMVSPTKKAASMTHTQALLERIWRETIGLSDEVEIDADTDFLDLGGNSLRQITAAREICAALGLRVPLGVFIRNTRINALAGVLDEHLKKFSHSFNSHAVAAQQLSHLERELYAMHEKSATPAAFNVAHVLVLQGHMRLDILERALCSVVSKHEALQACFVTSDGANVQKVVCEAKFRVERHSSKSSSSQEVIVDEFINRPFDLDRDQLTRVALVDEEGVNNTVRLVFVQHHMVTDQVSIKLFFRHVAEAYLDMTVGGRRPPRPKLAPPPYSAWAQWRRAQLSDTPPDPASVQYWRAQFAAPPRPKPLLPPPISPSSLLTRGALRPFTAPTRGGAGSLELYLAAVTLALGRVFGVADVVLGVPYLDRTEPGTEDIMGLFLDRLPVRLQVPEQEKITANVVASLAAEARAAVQGALAHAMPYQRITQIADGEGGGAAHFDVMVVYNRRQDSVARAFCIPGVHVTERAVRARGAKFPVLVEFTESDEEGGMTACEVEWFEDLVSSSAVDRLQDVIVSVLGV
ncbi:acetyl-CoA synthetase-like protein [Chaetomidium leptoderma]|uniref:Acetyl-CoA synthetase-like protein n=1 Tax=Chaetomidium leptoderma TaxID=669021 RepID=A0AAN6VP42_9PEZI|nr:acetyl-CoA synthetase-like protein [Chaetomidium leptoderma]